MRVAVFHPCEIWCAGIASLVQTLGFSVVVHSSAITAALERLSDDPPDIVMVAGSLAPQLDRLAVRKANDRVSIIAVIDPGEPLRRVVIGGRTCAAVISSEAPAKSMRACLERVAAGHKWIDPSLYRSRADTSKRGKSWNCLSTRELEIAFLAAEGLSNKQIARLLRLSDGTVKVHMHHILAKLDVSRREDLGPELIPVRPAHSAVDYETVAE